MVWKKSFWIMRSNAEIGAELAARRASGANPGPRVVWMPEPEHDRDDIRNYMAAGNPAAATIMDELFNDARLVTYPMLRRLEDKVLLLGHSWGTVLGTIYATQHPEKVSAYVGISQIADVPHSRRLSYAFAVAEARKRRNSKAISELRIIGPPPYASVDEMLTTGKWVERFGGVFHANLSTGKLIWSALSTDEANLIDLVRFGQGNRFSLIQLEDEISRLNLSERYLSFDVPVFFLLGRYDRHVPATLAEQYFARIKAPFKCLIWFEQSAHNPPFEEPVKFNQVLIEQVLPLSEPACH